MLLESIIHVIAKMFKCLLQLDSVPSNSLVRMPTLQCFFWMDGRCRRLFSLRSASLLSSPPLAAAVGVFRGGETSRGGRRRQRDQTGGRRSRGTSTGSCASPGWRISAATEASTRRSTCTPFICRDFEIVRRFRGGNRISTRAFRWLSPFPTVPTCQMGRKLICN